jgi:hypothetical protein
MSVKIAPVSADLLIKVAIGLAVIGAGVYLLRKASDTVSSLGDGIGNAFSSVTGAVGEAYDAVVAVPGQIADYAIATAQTGGQAWQDNVAARPPSQQEFFGTYQGPLVNDDGYDFGQLSG